MDEMYMKKALEIAKKGIGFVNPNPLVGAVIVKNNHIIAEGYHEMFGGNHAEINAFNDAKTSVKGSTMYVTLEPCSHYGKTPPCADAIIQKGIKKVVIASIDPNPLVSGKGIKRLKDAGIDVVSGVMDKENRQLNTIFFHYMKTQSPYVVMKTAMTLDGKIATKSKHSQWITNPKSRLEGHYLRQKVAAIMVGVGTVIADNPALTTRIPNQATKNPYRVIIDPRGACPLDAAVIRTAKAVKTWIVTTNLCALTRQEAYKKQGALLIEMPHRQGIIDLSQLMRILGEKGVDSILLEGGSILNYTALDAGIVNRIYSFIAPKIVGGETAKTPVGGAGKSVLDDAFKLRRVEIRVIDDDILLIYDVIKEESRCSQA